MTHEISTVCAWCHTEVVSFVGAPHMVEIRVQVHDDLPTDVNRVCLMCYADLIKFIAARQASDTQRTPR